VSTTIHSAIKDNRLRGKVGAFLKESLKNGSTLKGSVGMGCG
jgi:hypothetical protein